MYKVDLAARHQEEQSATDRAALTAFLVDNPELEALEALLEQFNIFEAIGAVRQELRHSDFLAFLLNPRESHGLGDAFVKQLLQKVLQTVEEPAEGITPIDLALRDLDELLVYREWRHIDILLLDEANRLAVIIENKVDSGEHSQQLRRYWETVHRHYPNCRIIGLYLTPDGHEPSDERYATVDYALIHSLIDNFVESRAPTIGPDVLTIMRHYTQLLRRHIMPDSDIAQLCQRIYRKHQRALDLIYEHRPDLQAELHTFLVELIEETPAMILDHSTKTWIRFLPASWDSAVLQQGQGWVPSNRMLLFEFGNGSERLHLKLTIGPGPQTIRQRLFDVALAHIPPFLGRGRNTLRVNHSAIFVRDFLRSSAYDGATIDDLAPVIREQWIRFIERDLPQFTEIIQSQSWLWSEITQPA